MYFLRQPPDLNYMANFPPSQQHTFSLGVKLSVFYFLLLRLPKLLLRVLSWGIWLRGESVRVNLTPHYKSIFDYAVDN